MLKLYVPMAELPGKYRPSCRLDTSGLQMNFQHLKRGKTLWKDEFLITH